MTVAAEESTHHAQRPPTDNDIVRLAQYHHCQTGFSLPPYLLSPASHDSLLSYLQSRSSSPSPSKPVSEYVVALLSLISLSPNTPPLSSLLASLLISYTQIFNAGKIPSDSDSLKTIQLFGTLLRYLHIKELKSVVDSILSGVSRVVTVDDAQLFDLLPVCFDLLRNPREAKASEIEYVDSAIDRVLNCEWHKGLLTKMVSLAKEFPFLDKERKSELLEKVFFGIKGIDLQDLPSLVYQLLVLASKGFCKREVIGGVVGFFGSKAETKVASVLRQIEGTVLLHVNFAVKQDPSLGQEVVALVKSDLRAFNHFTVAVLFSVARVRKFGENSLGILKTALLTTYNDYRLSKDCKWLPNELKEESFLHARLVEKSLLRAVSECRYGREHVVPSVIQFGFMLLESVEEGRSNEFVDSNGVLGIEKLSIQILGTLFEVHDMTRNEIIEQCKFRILSLKCAKSKPIVRLLGCLVQRYSLIMLEFVHHLKELLDYFTFMEGNISCFLVSAIIPLIKFSHELQDYTILVIRKAMFRREDTVRVAATKVLTDLILAEKQAKRDSSFTLQDSSSQASSSQHTEMSSIVRGNLFTELNGLLQRCLYQQAKVKEVVYDGLVKLILIDPSSGGHVLDFLMPHFLRFFRQDTDFQLGITSCIKVEGGRFIIDEPLDRLLFCISWILLLQPHNSSDRPSDTAWPCFGFSLTQETEQVGRNVSQEVYSSALVKVRSFLLGKKLGDIVGQSEDTVSASLEEDKRKSYCSIILGIVKVLLNYIITDLEKQPEGKKGEIEKEIVALIDLYESLEKDVGKSKQGNIGKRVRFSSRNKSDDADVGNASINEEREKVPFLATSSIYQLFLVTFKLYSSKSVGNLSDSQDHSQSSSAKTEKSISSVFSFTLHVCVGHIRSSLCMKEENPLRPLVYGDMKVLGPPLLKVVYLLKPGPLLATGQTNKENKGRKDAEGRKQCLHLAFLGLKELLSIYSTGSNLNGLLEDLLAVPATEDDATLEECSESSKIEDLLVKSVENFMEKIMKPMITDLIAQNSNDVEILCDIMLMLGDTLPDKFKQRHGSWAHQICRSCETSNTTVAKSIVKLSISLTTSPGDLCIAVEVAKELQNVIGLENSDNLQVSESYMVINQSTSASVTSCILQSIESAIVDMDWASKKLKNFYVVSQKNIHLNHDAEGTFGLALEEALYSMAESTVRILSSFVLMNLKDSQAAQFLRLTVRFYKQLAQIVKLRIAPKGCKQNLPSLKFQKLVELTCRSLTVPLYPFLAEMQKEQQESVSSNSKGIINKIKQENKCIPDLIFQIEDYERYLIQLSKVTKFNLLRHAKRSTARDFKIIEDAETPAGGEDGGNQAETQTRNNDIGVNEDDLREGSEDDSEKTLSSRNVNSGSSRDLHSDKAIAAEEDDEEEGEGEGEGEGEEGEEEEGEEEGSGFSRPKKIAKKSWVVDDSDEDSETF
ncbi:Fanconi anemia group I protein homolog isoform X2 [Eutrema salsugineum]|uniref:Fanconi anemia group I protein homolog isoform X2 n=1 Tax=Eutrema salsugineum TaxID=72664 RepID=UPI000CED41AD|nr:Fanconi anemia group I protein homolog isoform X2 [Eutrema salsugineum]